MMALPGGAPSSPGGIPPQLMQLIAQQQAGQGGDPEETGANDGGLSCLQDTLNDMAKLLHELTAPQDVQDATKAMTILAGIQTRLMGSAGGSPAGR